MFIPNVYTKVKVGDTVLLRQDYNLNCGTFTKGHKFIVLEILSYSKKFKVIDENDYELTLDQSILIKDVSFSEAKEIEICNKEHQRILNIIIDNCPQRDYDYDEYERFEVCKLIKKTYTHNAFCKPSLECAAHCNDKTKNKLKLPLRSLKIKNIKKRSK